MTPARINKAQVKESILDAALAIAKEGDWTDVTIREVARRVNYTAPVVYEYFQHKEAMLGALCLRGSQLRTNLMRQAYDNCDTPRERLTGVAWAYWSGAWQEIELYQLAFGQANIDHGPMDEIEEKATALHMVSSGIQEHFKGQVDDQRAVLLFASLWAMLHGYISLVLAEKLHKDEAYMSLEVALEWFLDKGVKS